jgi:hypothetical protein
MLPGQTLLMNQIDSHKMKQRVTCQRMQIIYMSKAIM